MEPVSTALTLFGAYQTYKGAQESAEAAEYQTDQMVADERNRSRAEMAERRARLAASNVTASGSPQRFLQSAEEQDRRRLKNLQRSGKMQADAYRSTGTAQAFGSLAKIPGYWV